MITVTIVIQAPGWAAQGVKEQLAMMLERFGDTRVVEVTECSPASWQGAAT